MNATTLDCVYCHSTLAQKHHADPVHPYVCDGCMESIRTNQRPLGVPEPTGLEPPTDTEKPRRKRKAKPE